MKPAATPPAIPPKLPGEAPRGGTCAACAKAKVKCDKVRPKCARCLRLGIDCNEQLRGRGRPPNSHRQDRAISHGWPGAGRVMFDPNDPRPTMREGFPFPFQLGDGVVIQPTFTLVDMIKASMQAVATSIQTDPRFKDGLLGDMRKKFLAVLRWLHAVACVAGTPELSAEVTKIAASFSLTDELGAPAFAIRPGLTIEAKRDVKIPAFVAALNSGGSAFLVQVMVRGASVFFCNDDMASQFINAAEAEEEHAKTKDDPGSVMKRLIAPRDRPAYLRAAARLLVHLPQLASETSFMAHIVTREAQRVLCLVQLRASFSADGENVVMGTKLIPVPEPRAGESVAPGFPGMPQFMMPFPMLGNQQGGAGGGVSGIPFNPSGAPLPWNFPMPGAMGSSGEIKVGGKSGEGAEVGKDDSEARKRYEANWETRRKTKKSRKEDGEEGDDKKGEDGEGAKEDGESYEEQQKNVRRRQQQMEKQQMEQIQLQYFQQMQLQHQQQLMASMGQMPFGMMGMNGQPGQPAPSATTGGAVPGAGAAEVAPPSESTSSSSSAKGASSIDV